MRVIIITDQHFGFKRQSTVFHEYFLKFYNEVFFPFIEQHKITTIVDMGDTFDNRKNLDLTTIEWAKRNYYDRLESLNCQVHTIVGNHTSYYRNTNKINTPELLLDQYSNIQTYSSPTVVNLDNLPVLFIPWINQENEEESLNIIQTTEAKVAMGHLELNGFYVNRGTAMEDGRDPDIFSRFKKVFTGHYHTRSDNGTVYYTGNPYEMFFNDSGDKRGFVVFDTETLKHAYVNNPFSLFDYVYYEDTNIEDFDFSSYAGKIIKVIVRKKSDNVLFDQFITNFYSVGVSDLKIIENYTQQTEQEFDFSLENEDTFTLIQRFVEESEIDLNKEKLKFILSEIHKEACELV